MKKQLAAMMAISAAALLSPAAHAVHNTNVIFDTTVIWQPKSVTANIAYRKRDSCQCTFPDNLPDDEYSVNNLINQRGLSIKYQSGKTNFHEYTAQAIHPPPASMDFEPEPNQGSWLGHQGFGTNFPFVDQVVLTFDLGREMNIKGMAIWNNRHQNFTKNFPIKAFDLSLRGPTISSMGETLQEIGGLRDQGALTSGGDGLDLTNGSLNNKAQTFDLSNPFRQCIARYVDLEITQFHGTGSVHTPSALEVAFEVEAVPFEVEAVPFELGPILGIIGIVAVGGINYFRNSK